MDNFDITLDKNLNKPLYIQLYNEIRESIVEGKLKPHTKLPAIRKLALKLKVNNVTIVNAYNLLQENDLVYKRVGSGTYISDIQPYDNEGEDSIRMNDTITYDFASTTPDPNLFPVDDFKSVIDQVLSRDKGNAFVCSQPQGYESLRISIKKFLYKSKVYVDADDIHIVSGAQQGIDVISKTLVNYGDFVFCESPTYAGAIAAFKSRGAKIIDIKLEKDGMDLQTLENKLLYFKPQFIYLMPNFHNPTGISYSLEKRKQLLNLAEKYDTYIVEDDFSRDINFNTSKPQMPLKSLDKNNRVIYIKSFSKTLMPGLRLGFTIVPRSLQHDVLAAKQTSDISTSGLIQKTFDLYLRKGMWDKHTLFMNEIYSNKYNKMVEALNKHLPKDVNYTTPSGGLGFWICMPEGFSSLKFAQVCKKNDISIVPGSYFFINKNDSNCFRLSVAFIKESIITDGVKSLSNLLEDFISNTKNKYVEMLW